MPKTVVIGGGIGGSACAGMLAKEGHEVHLFERNAFLGGKCSAYVRDSFHSDWGVHGFSRGGAGPLVRIANAVGGRLEFISPDPISLVMDHFHGKTRRYPYPLHIRKFLNQARMGIHMGVKPWNYLAGMRLFQTLGRFDWGAIREWETQTVKELISHFTDDEQTHRFMNMFCLLMFAQPYDEASAGEYIYVFSTMIAKAQGGYPRGGCQAITDAFLENFENRGGKIHLRRPVAKIITDGEAVKGVETEEGFVQADVVISNAGIKNTLVMAGQQAFPEDYWLRIHSLKDSYGVVTIKYALKQRVLKFPILLYVPDATGRAMFDFLEQEDGAPEDPMIFMPVVTNFDPNLGPPGSQMAIAATICTAKPGVNVTKVAEVLDNRVKDLFPEIAKNLLWQHVTTQDDIKRISGRANGECIGLAQTTDQVGPNRPSPRLPIRGLYCAGADTGGRGVGTEMAAESALMTVEMVKNDLKGLAPEATPIAIQPLAT